MDRMSSHAITGLNFLRHANYQHAIKFHITRTDISIAPHLKLEVLCLFQEMA